MQESTKFRGPVVKPECVKYPPQPRILMPAMPPLKLIALLEFWAKMALRRYHFKRLFLPLLQESDEFLDDIGFRKQEVFWAIQLPLKVDALKALEVCRRERTHSTRLVSKVIELKTR